MKVIHLSTQDVGGGGGGFDAAYRLHRNMIKNGVESSMVVLNKTTNDPSVIAIKPRLSLLARLRLWLFSKTANYKRRRKFVSNYFHEQSGDYFSARILVDQFPFRPDAIIVHWVSTFLSPHMMRQLADITGSPVYWYMMDMAPLTGGCHYAFGCQGYMRDCADCPQLANKSGLRTVARRQLGEKLLHFRDSKIRAIAASEWLKELAKKSVLFADCDVKKILLGLDVETFKPKDRMAARASFGLPKEKRIIFFGAQNLNEERKGMSYLQDSLSKLHSLLADNLVLREKVLVMVAGSGVYENLLNIPFEYKHIGLLVGDDQLATAYRAADIFLNSSIEDAGPMMINESILCGTPVVSFDMGVAPDLVHSGETGYRAKLRNADDMAEGLRLLLQMDDDGFDAMRQRCRATGLLHCHSDVQVEGFISIFTSDKSGSPTVVAANQ